MRVLLINHFPLQGSGSGIYTLNIAKELIKRGHQVYVLDVDNKIDKTHYDFEHSTILFNSQTADLPFNFPCFTTHPRSTNTFYQLTNDEMTLYINAFIKHTKDIVGTFKPDIIHAQHLWIAPYAAFVSNTPYIITAHGTDLMGFKKDERYRKYALEGSNNAKFIIAISNQVYNDTMELYHPVKDKLIIIPNGFDDNIFKVKDEKKEDVLKRLGTNYIADKIVSFVGKFTDFKGIDILIKAARIVNKSIPNVGFYLAGDGGLRSDMEKLANDLHLKNIIFLGHQTQENVASLYSIADLSVVPSRIEPFGLVAIEALACGTPVVATNAGGLPDFINGDVGNLVAMNNPNALAEAIINELKNETKLTKGKYAQKYAIENYSWNANLKNVVNLYQKMLE